MIIAIKRCYLEEEKVPVFITDNHRSQIRAHLSVMERQYDVLQALKPHSPEDFQEQPVLRAAAERALHIALESLTDIGNIMIDALVMRDAASYEDIFDILTEENVFDQEFAAHFRPVVLFRKKLAHEYMQLNVEDVYHYAQAHADDFPSLRDSIAKYVQLTF